MRAVISEVEVGELVSEDIDVAIEGCLGTPPLSQEHEEADGVAVVHFIRIHGELVDVSGEVLNLRKVQSSSSLSLMAVAAAASAGS